MNELDSPNYTEFTYEKKVTRRILVERIALIAFYVAFVTAFFLVCYVTRVIPVFAMCPLFLWMLVFFTWRLVSYDVYYTFNHGEMELGRMTLRRRRQVRTAVLRVDVKTATLVMPSTAARNREVKVKKRYDFSAKASSDELIMLFPGKRGSTAVTLESTPRLRKLLLSYARAADTSAMRG
ncbi:MAG: hypothetical protein IJX38_00570 [Clostridia bacterium]|nr:hypothetical protein [Clostridia bacterium]